MIGQTWAPGLPAHMQRGGGAYELSINLRSNSKIHFKKRKRRKYEKYLKSLLVRGVKLWEMLPEKVQKATTKVKFKSFVKQICKT